jgi:cobalt-zinc-cadmium efflux system membrane fusion protein
MHRSRSASSLRNAALVSGGLLFLCACGEGGGPNGADGTRATAGATAPSDPAVIRVGPELVDQIRVGSGIDMELSEVLRLAGRLEVNAGRTARIGAPVTGRIIDIKALPGKEVREGETRAEPGGSARALSWFDDERPAT